LIGSHPNPVGSAGGVLAFHAPCEGSVEVRVLTARGETVKTFGRNFPGAGDYELAWKPENQSGSALAAAPFYLLAVFDACGQRSKAGVWITVLR
jgi:hypothetical protein